MSILIEIRESKTKINDGIGIELMWFYNRPIPFIRS